MADSKKTLQIELRRELEHAGFDVQDADDLAKAEIEGGPAGEDDFNPPLHVVPIHRGWVVVRSVSDQDLGAFDSREEAVATANAKAKSIGAKVLVHDEAGLSRS